MQCFLSVITTVVFTFLVPEHYKVRLGVELGLMSIFFMVRVVLRVRFSIINT